VERFHLRERGGAVTPRAKEILAVTLAACICILVVVGVLIGVLAGYKAFERYQKRANAQNQVTLNNIKIRQTGQLVQVAKQQAQIRVQTAVGIREAQDEIAKTLTPLYIQFEAIQAQLAMAHSDNHTFMWIPAGSNGVPIVDPAALAENPAGTP
jgi:flagellar basal body-associated protein FliL